MMLLERREGSFVRGLVLIIEISRITFKVFKTARIKEATGQGCEKEEEERQGRAGTTT